MSRKCDLISKYKLGFAHTRTLDNNQNVANNFLRKQYLNNKDDRATNDSIRESNQKKIPIYSLNDRFLPHANCAIKGHLSIDMSCTRYKICDVTVSTLSVKIILKL